jgi:hypothetical protein
MLADLIAARERAMDRADAALDRAWPGRSGAGYVAEMRAAAAAIEQVAAELKAAAAPAIERSRTHRYLGSIYSDLAPALGRDWLRRARDAYLEAERLLPEAERGLDRAKLDFNFANTLRQLDPNDVPALEEARRRLAEARAVFAKHAPEHVSRVDELTSSVDRLLALMPLVQAVQRTQAELEHLGHRIRAGGDLQALARDLRRITGREGGIAGLIGRTRAMLANLPSDMKGDPRFAEVERMLGEVTSMATSPDASIVTALRERLARDAGRLDNERTRTLEGLIDAIERFAARRDDSIEGLIERTETLSAAARERIELLHYPTYGIPRPPGGSRAAEMVEECWVLRRFLAEEMGRPGKGSDESRELLELNIRASNADRRIYEAGGDDARAARVDEEELRPLAIAVRAFSAREYVMLARPIWTAAGRAVDTNAVLYAGPDHEGARIAKTCEAIGMKRIAPPGASGFADARWQQIHSAMVGVFDMRAAEGPSRAAVAYELGIALTIGRPVVVIAAAGQVLPFDVDRRPVVAGSDTDDARALQTAIRSAIVAPCPRGRGRGALATLEYALACFPRPHASVYVDQTLRLLAQQRTEPDRLALSRTLSKLVQFLDDGNVLISPAWAPAYPGVSDRRLFHVMPFAPAWADGAAAAARAASAAAGTRHVRGDEAADANVIRSIWEELARATYVLVDLTGFSANVALELGIAHTLGRPCLMVGQGDTVRSLFPMIAKQRVHSYRTAAELEDRVRRFLG